ncbi:peptidase domain-containing ABC transporter [Phnomibacter ginsenosidimutans]|uniref:ATP-binding cassette domain-containing protein n=1 Tax=Phnomibacter ginsenosidimutans TaxID=2676868 RepID=A0A6I6GRJ4_9BACT|nr:ATP-binding cassette domain-containing protein [Phnomibacter ginsenosidimutans]QGW27719.1 ATP-binding cassette domain-containing protein [Phnomibacter ginsenosidimutans]
MAIDTQQAVLQRSIFRLFRIIRLERREISAIYFYAILFGLLQLTLPLGIQSIINFVLAGSFSTSMIILIGAVVTGVLFTGILQVNQMKLNEKIQQNLFAQYTFEFAHRIPKVDMKSVDGYYMPELVNRFFDVISLQKGLSKLLLDLPVAMIQIVFGLILLSFYNAVFIVFGLLLLVILFLIIRYSSARGLATSIEESDYKYGVASWLQEIARVMKSIKFSRNTGIHITKTDELVSGYLEARTSHFKILLLQYWSLILFKVLITLAMLVVGGFLLIDQELNVGQFVAAEIVIITVLASIEKFIISLDKVYDVLTSVEKLGKVIDKPLEVSGNMPLDTTEGISIETRDLSFAYNKDQVILKHVDMRIPAGKLVCIAGPEGSGKSTLLRLLTGSFSEFDGKILINGLPIGNYSLDSLRNATGIYFSQQEIFEGTLWENVSLGNCAYTPQEMIRLAEKIGLGNFIAEQPKGFETYIDPTGRRLSKTTTQRILFLRALAGKPKLLLLEEPWEGMDDSSKISMIRFLQQDLRDCTIVVAASDPELMHTADIVYNIQPVNPQL